MVARPVGRVLLLSLLLAGSSWGAADAEAGEPVGGEASALSSEQVDPTDAEEGATEEEASQAEEAAEEASQQEGEPHSAPESAQAPSLSVEESAQEELFEFAPQDPSPYVAPPEDEGPSRWVEVGILGGGVLRSSSSEGIRYPSGATWGVYARPELASWLGVRLSYRQEKISVAVSEGAFDTPSASYDFDFEQPALSVISFGARLEPTWVIHPRFRAFGIVGISWMRMRAEAPRAAGFWLEGSRTSTELNLPLGVGAAVELLPNWIQLGLSVTYGFSFDRRGPAWEPLQAIVDGGISYLAPLPEFSNVMDALLTLGVIL